MAGGRGVMRLGTIVRCAVLLGFVSGSALGADEPSPRPLLEASLRGGLRLPRSIEGAPDLPPGFGVAVSGDVRVLDYFAGGVLVEQSRFAFAPMDGGFLGYTFTGLLLRGYVLAEGPFDPYLEMVLGGANPIGISHEGGMGYRAAVGIDYLVLSWLELGFAGSYTAFHYYYLNKAEPPPLPFSGSRSAKQDWLKGGWGLDVVVTLLGLARE